MTDNFDPREGSTSEFDKDVETEIRPREFEDFSGQEKVVENLKIFVQAASMRGEALDHVLLHGPPGLGKTTLAHIIAAHTKSRSVRIISRREREPRPFGRCIKLAGFSTHHEPRDSSLPPV